MARPNKIWFRKDIGWWMVTVGGRRVRLAKGRQNRPLADRKFHELKAEAAVLAEASPGGALRVADVIDRFLAWTTKHRSSETNRNHLYYGQKFAEHSGFLAAADLRPHHVTSWVDARAWGQTTERNARRSILRAFNWADSEGLHRPNPLKGMRCPAAKTRERYMTDHEFRSILRNSSAEFKVLMYVLRMTGCRPKEARTLRWRDVREDRWILAQHKTAGKTGKSRAIYLVKPVIALMDVLRRRRGGAASGDSFVFTNARGEPWTVNAMRLRMDRIRKRAGLPRDLWPASRTRSGTTCSARCGASSRAAAAS